MINRAASNNHTRVILSDGHDCQYCSKFGADFLGPMYFKDLNKTIVTLTEQVPGMLSLR